MLEKLWKIFARILEKHCKSFWSSCFFLRKKHLTMTHSADDSKRFHFDGYTLDTAKGCLYYQNQEIHLTPKAFAVLHYLLTQPGRLVSKEQLFRAVWPDVIVSDATLASSIRELRQALNEDTKAPRFIETRHRRGYRFIAEVTSAFAQERLNESSASRQRWPRWAIIGIAMALVFGTTLWFYPSPEQVSEATGPNQSELPMPAKPSIAVLPFSAIGNDPEHSTIATGVTDSIITTLAKVPDLSVIARQSTLGYQGKTVPVQTIAAEQGVRYVLKGSVQTGPNRIRIHVQLVDAINNHHVWTEQYDREFGDIFELQDEISRRVMTELQVKLTRGEEARIWQKSARNPEAYLLFLRGIELKEKFTQLEMAEAQQLFEQALALDPNFADAWAWLGWTYLMQSRYQWVENLEHARTQALESARQALAADGTNPTALGLRAELYIEDGDVEQALALYEKALYFNPNDAMTANLYGDTLVLKGQYKKGLSFIKESLRLSPYAPGWFFAALGRAYFAVKDYENAIAALENAKSLAPNWHKVYLNLAYTYAEAGQIEKARAAVAKSLEIEPSYTLQRFRNYRKQMFPFQEHALLEREMAALLKAGLPPFQNLPGQ